MTLEQLAERVEQARGPDRELDAAIAVAISDDQGARVVKPEAGFFFTYKPGWIRTSDDRSYLAPSYTASLDAAVSLVPEGWHLIGMEDRWQDRRWRVFCAKMPDPAQRSSFAGGKTFGVSTTSSEAVTASLALTAAALRARATPADNRAREGE